MAKKKYYQTAEFRKLNREWTKNLSDSGFRDVESEYDKEHGTGRKDHIDFDPVRMYYYDRCQEFLSTGKFLDETDRFIFEKHCEGYTNRAIADLLGDEVPPLRCLKHSAVDERVNKALKRAGIEPIVFKF